MAQPPKELKRLLARYDAQPKSLALSLRDVVLHELAPPHEYIFAMRSKVVLLYSASERVIEDGICNIGVFRNHVTLTFVEGVELDDPRHVLQGRGRIMRHLRVNTAADLASDDLRGFLRQARTLAGLPRGHGAAVVTRVNAAAAPSRARR